MFERIGLWYYTKFTPETETDQKKANNHALLGFIFGVCSLVIFPLFAIPGFILSKNAMNKEKLSPGILEDGNKGLAKAGFILSIIGFASLLVFVIYIIVLLGGYGFGY
ncbi:MAG: DUF4190 domain-containing protein [Lacibacter sp.]|nr:DUF4190 domain-containing protein [Lacibacter sp.]